MEKSIVFNVLQKLHNDAQEINETQTEQLLLERLLQKADTLLDGMKSGDNIDNIDPDNICRLIFLGYTCSEQEDFQEIGKCLFGSLKHFLSQQVGARVSFAVALTRQGENIKCLIGTENPAMPLLSASYGGVEIEEETSFGKTYANNFTAHILRFSDIEDKIDVTVEYEKYCSWIDRVASAYLERDYCVKVSCVPISEDLLKKRYNKAAELYNQLSCYKTFEWGVGYNNSSSSSKNGVVVSGGNSQGTSSQLSSRSEDYRVCQTLTKLECEMKRLRAAKDLGGYQIQFQMSAETEEDLEILYAIISGVLVEERLRLIRNSDTKGWLLGSELCYVLQLPSTAFPGFGLYKNVTDVMPHPFRNTGITLGKAFFNGMPNCSFSIPIEQFNRHAFVCGMTGSGKTNTIFSLLTQMKLPFLVIEPVKGEYRRLKRELPNLKVYTMDVADGNTLKLNPFWFPKGSNIQYHMDALKALIISSFSLTAAMPNIIEQCISKIYFNKGWNTGTGRNLYEGKLPDQYLYPTFNDLKQEVDKYLKESKYVGETLATYQGALLTRLSSYTEGIKGRLLNVPSHPDFSEWEQESVVIELDMLSEDADKAIVMGSILLQYFQYLKLKKVNGSDGTFSHLLIIEEAHRLFKNVDTKHRDLEIANPQAQLVETLSNLMAEIRAYGEGIIVVDQSPVKIAEDVVRNSNIKLVHRLDMRDDIGLVQNALLLDRDEKMFSRLKCGQALARFEGMELPALVQIDHYKGGTRAPAKEFDNEQIPVIGDWSPVADSLLSNMALREEIVGLANRLVRSVLYDDLSSINDWFSNSVKKLQDILAAFGYLQQECKFTSEVYKHLLLVGVEDAIAKNPVYGNQFVFKYHLKMLFERALQFSKEFKEYEISRKESILFAHFRQVQIYPVLEDTLKYRIPGYREILKVCLQHSMKYMELIKLLAGLDKTKSDDTKTFVSNELQKIMIPPVSELLISEISQNLDLLLEKTI